MFIFVSIIFGLALWLITKSMFGERLWLIISIIIISVFCGISSLYSECSDGWESYSIGRQGACSYHGGVEIKLNSLGIGILLFSFITFIIYYIVLSHKDELNRRKYELNRRFFKIINIRRISRLPNISIIKKAIKNKKEISFDYKQENGEKIYNIVQPLKINIYKKRMFYIEGFCKKRNTNIEFIINKMSDIKIIESSI